MQETNTDNISYWPFRYTVLHTLNATWIYPSQTQSQITMYVHIHNMKLILGLLFHIIKNYLHVQIPNIILKYRPKLINVTVMVESKYSVKLKMCFDWVITFIFHKKKTYIPVANLRDLKIMLN